MICKSATARCSQTAVCSVLRVTIALLTSLRFSKKKLEEEPMLNIFIRIGFTVVMQVR